MQETNRPIKQVDLNLIEKVGIASLKEAFEKHQLLGPTGIEQVRKNQFGDTAMRGDIEAENAVLEVLKQSSFPIIVRSEEHGDVEIGKKALYFGVLDGIDGSSWYRSEQGVGRYATLFGIFHGTNPRYGDYLFNGLMEHATNRLFYALRGKGSFILDLKTGEKIPIRTSGNTSLDNNTSIYVDQYWDINKEKFLSRLQGHNVQPYHLCSSVHYADVASGQADLALECTRKENLEIAAVYGLIHEAGGKIVSFNGEELANKSYRDFGQTEHIPVITAATPALAQQAVTFFNRV